MKPCLQIGCFGEGRRPTKPFPAPLTLSRAKAASAPAGHLGMAPPKRSPHSTVMGRSRRVPPGYLGTYPLMRVHRSSLRRNLGNRLLSGLRPSKLVHAPAIDFVLRHARIDSAAHRHSICEAARERDAGTLHGRDRGAVRLEAASCRVAGAGHLIARRRRYNRWPARHGDRPHGSGLAAPIVYDELPLARGLGFQRRVLPRGGRGTCGLAPSQCNGNRDQQKCTLHQALPPFTGAKPMVELAAMSNRFLESMWAFRFRKLMDHPSRPERRVGTAKPITAANQSASIDSHHSLDPNLNFQDK